LSDSKELILQRLLAQIPDEYDKSVGSFFHDTQAPLAIEHEAQYRKLDGILDRGFAKTATGGYLEQKVAEQGMTRKPATFAEGVVRITGAVGAGIPVGVKVSSDLALYTVIAPTNISAAGFADVPVRCDVAGAGGSVPVGAIKDFPVSVSGLSTVTNPAPITGGYNAETDAELRRRYFDKVSAPATSGNKQHYVNWAMEIPGVGDVRVLPLANGPGTVKVIIINAHKQPAEPALVQTVAAHIEENRPVGAAVTVVTAKAVAINVSATLVATGPVQTAVETAINDYLKRTAFTVSYVSVAHIGAAILNVPGVLDFSNLKVNGGAVNIPVGTEEIAVLGVVSLV